MSHPTESHLPPAEPDAQDMALLAEVGAALASNRQQIAADRAGFKVRLRARLAAEPAAPRRAGSSRVTKVIRPRSWVHSLRYYAAAVAMIGVVLGLLSVSGLLGVPNLSQPAGDIRTARMTAEPIPIGLTGNDLTPGELFKPFDNQKMLLIIDTSENEACLALIPQALIDREYSDDEKQALTKRPHWDLTVEQGRIQLPVEAYSKALGTTRTPLLLLKINGHYEIWTADALRRYRERAQNRESRQADPVVEVEAQS